MNNAVLSLHELNKEIDNKYSLPDWVKEISLKKIIRSVSQLPVPGWFEKIFMNIPLLWEEFVQHFKTLKQHQKIPLLNIFSNLKYEINSTDLENYDYICDYINSTIFPQLSEWENTVMNEFIKQSQVHFNNYICDVSLYNLQAPKEEDNIGIKQLYPNYFEKHIFMIVVLIFWGYAYSF